MIPMSLAHRHPFLKRAQCRFAHARGPVVAAMVAMALALAMSTPLVGHAAAEPRETLREQLVGTWLFVSSINKRKDGSTFDRWGNNPTGVLMFDSAGNFSQIIMRSEVNLFGGKSIFSFGTYKVDESSKTILTHVVGSSLSKLIGTKQRRIIKSLTASELHYVNPKSASGTSIEARWKRAAPPAAIAAGPRTPSAPSPNPHP
jgi:hypothetical protein